MLRIPILKTSVLSLLSLAAVTLPGYAQAPATPPQHVHFSWTNFDSNIPGVALHNDAHLVNPRGVVPDTKGGTVVADEGAGVLTGYDILGRRLPVGKAQHVITVPPAAGGTTGSPTGIILNHGAFAHDTTGDFIITSGAVSGPSKYLTCTADGTIAGYNGDVDPANAITAVHAAVTPADYEGLALSRDGQENVRLYAANFAGVGGSIDVFDKSFAPVVPVTAFVDANAVVGYAPYNIEHYAFVDRATRKTKRFLIVAYAPQSPTGAAGEGYINVFDTDGTLIKRLVPQSSTNGLNQPWGMAIARHEAGRHDDVLLVANHGDGTITRFSLGGSFSGTPVGAATRPSGEALEFAGLWAIHFGAGIVRNTVLEALAEDELIEVETTLHFSADLGSTSDGLVGQIFRR